MHKVDYQNLNENNKDFVFLRNIHTKDIKKCFKIEKNLRKGGVFVE